MKEFMTYLDSRIEAGKTKTAALLADGCQDDANFMKVQTNIYEICKTVSQVLMNKPGAGIQGVKTQLERFRTEWGAALEKAKQHNNIKSIAVEETKLSALDDIMAHFEEVNEG